MNADLMGSRHFRFLEPLMVVALVSFCLGGISFWLPGIILHVLLKNDFGGLAVVLLTILQPVALLGTYQVVLHFRDRQGARRSAAIFMLIGVWLLGTLAMQISFTPLGKGFSGLSVKAAILDLIWESIPVYTFSLATYYGSLGALIAATVLMIVMHRRYERGNYVFRPRRPEAGK